MATEKKSAKEKSKKSISKKMPAKKAESKAPAKKRSVTKKEKQVKTSPPKKTVANESKEKSFVTDAAENIEARAKSVKNKTAEIASDIAEKTSSFSDTVLKGIKKGVSEAYEAGAKAIEGVSEAAQDYTEKYKNKIEINRLKTKQDKQYTKLGSLIFDKYKVIGITADKLFMEKEIVEIINEIENTARQIVKQGQALDRSEKVS